jgi:hypothetical protein
MENGLAQNPYKYERKRKRKIIQAQKIKFDDSVWFDITNYHLIRSSLNILPILQNNKQQAIPIRGTYVDDLVKIKKNRSLNHVI